jgi:hypothetical protein
MLKRLLGNIIVLNVHASCEDKSDDVDSFYEELKHVFDQFPRYDINILLCDFNTKVGREDIFKPTIGNETSLEISNENEASVVKFSTSKNVLAKSTMFPHRSIHKYTWKSPDGKMHYHIDHVLIVRRRRSSILDVRCFRGADCDSGRYTIVVNITEGLAVSKRLEENMYVDRFNLKNLNEGEFMEQCQVTIRNKVSALGNLDDIGDINREPDAIREDIKVSAKVKRSVINHGLMRNVQNWLNEGSRLHHSGCRTQV